MCEDVGVRGEGMLAGMYEFQAVVRYYDGKERIRCVYFIQEKALEKVGGEGGGWPLQ